MGALWQHIPTHTVRSGHLIIPDRTEPTVRAYCPGKTRGASVSSIFLPWNPPESEVEMYAGSEFACWFTFGPQPDPVSRTAPYNSFSSYAFDITAQICWIICYRTQGNPFWESRWARRKYQALWRKFTADTLGGGVSSIISLSPFFPLSVSMEVFGNRRRYFGLRAMGIRWYNRS